MRKPGLLIFLLVFTAGLHAQQALPQIDFSRADSRAAALQGHPIDDLPLLSTRLVNGLDNDVEKFRAIFTWVATNISNDHDLYLKNKRNREKLRGNAEALQAWNREISAKAMKSMLEKRRTVCSGYAYLLRKLAIYAGIQCEIIHGYGRTVESNIGGAGIPNHTWNVVRLNDQWHVSDPTWASGAWDRAKQEVVNKFEPSYFLAPPQLFVRNHFPLDTAWLLIKNKPSLRQFLDAPIIYVNTFQLDIHPQAPATLEANTLRGESIAFSFSTPAGANFEDKLRLLINDGLVRARPELRSSGGGRNNYEIEYRFQRKGSYTVHLVAGADPVVTWQVSVK